MSAFHYSVARARSSVLLNIGLFQAGWWACVLSAAHHRAAQAALALAAAVAMLVVIHVAPLRTLLLALYCLLLGAIIESAFVASHVTAYPGSMASMPGHAPLWMAGLWALFSTTLDVSLSWLKGRALLGSTLGAAAGALSYAAGARLGALVLPSRYSLWAIAAVWALVLPLLVEFANRPQRAEPAP